MFVAHAKHIVSFGCLPDDRYKITNMYRSDETSNSNEYRHKDNIGRSTEVFDFGEQFQLKFPVHRDSSYYHEFSRGPISAPAVPYNCEDYFSWSPESINIPNDAGGQSSGEQSHNHQQTVHAQQAAQEALMKRRYSGDRIRHRSKLSCSVIEEQSPGDTSSSGLESFFPRPEPVYGNEQKSPAAKRHNVKDEVFSKTPQKIKPSKKPGFRLRLDKLNSKQSQSNSNSNSHSHSSLHKQQHSLGTTAGPLFNPKIVGLNEKTEFFEPDTTVQSHAGEVSQTRGNITPLMFPPQTEELGYFGIAEPSGVNTEKDLVPGGYLNVTSKIYDPVGHSGVSGNNSDPESYLAFAVNDFETTQVFENNKYHNDFHEYPEEVENTRAESHFTPVSEFKFNPGEEFHSAYDNHQSESSNHDQNQNQNQNQSQNQNQNQNQNHKKTHSGHQLRQFHDYNNANSYSHVHGLSVDDRHSNYDSVNNHLLNHQRSYNHEAEFQEHHYHMNQNHEYQSDTSHAHSGEPLYNQEQARIRHQTLEDSHRDNEGHNIKHGQLYQNQNQNQNSLQLQLQNSDLVHRGEFSNGHFNESYLGSHSDKQRVGEQAEARVVSRSNFKGKDTFPKDNQGLGYENYMIDKPESGEVPQNSFSATDNENLADPTTVAQVAEISDTDKSDSAEKKAPMKKGKGAKGVKGIVCSVCEKFIVRDFSRHVRTHDEAGRFQCCFPPSYCKHKSRKFNRPYDYKKHLLNAHFKFDDPKAKTAVNLTVKLSIPGQCNACGERFVANDWLEDHILVTDLKRKCSELQRMEAEYNSEKEKKPELDP